jgi:chromosome segregation ATPase
MTDRELLESLAKAMTEMNGKIGGIEGKIISVEGKIGSVEDRVGSIEGRIGDIEGQLSETNQIVKALMHRTEELDAKYDGLLHATATKESIERLEAKMDKMLATQATQGESINILALRQLQAEAEINALKKAK